MSIDVSLSDRFLLRFASEFRFEAGMCARLDPHGDHWLVCRDAGGRGNSVLCKNGDGELGFNGPGQWFFCNAEELRLSREVAITMAMDIAEGRLKARDP